MSFVLVMASLMGASTTLPAADATFFRKCPILIPMGSAFEQASALPPVVHGATISRFRGTGPSPMSEMMTGRSRTYGGTISRASSLMFSPSTSRSSSYVVFDPGPHLSWMTFRATPRIHPSTHLQPFTRSRRSLSWALRAWRRETGRVSAPTPPPQPTAKSPATAKSGLTRRSITTRTRPICGGSRSMARHTSRSVSARGPLSVKRLWPSPRPRPPAATAQRADDPHVEAVRSLRDKRAHARKHRLELRRGVERLVTRDWLLAVRQHPTGRAPEIDGPLARRVERPVRHVVDDVLWLVEGHALVTAGDHLRAVRRPRVVLDARGHRTSVEVAIEHLPVRRRLVVHDRRRPLLKIRRRDAL